MPQPPTIIDAPVGDTQRHGSQIINFGGAGALIAEEIEFNMPLRSIDFSDDLGKTNKSAYSTMKGTGSMIVQLKTGTSRVFRGDSGAFFLPDGGSLPFFVTNAGVTYSQNSITKIRIEFAERLETSNESKFWLHDGDLHVAAPCGQIRVIPHPLPPAAGAVVFAQKFRQYYPAWSPQALGTAGPQNSYLVDETQLEDTGVAGIVTWDRVWATKPNSYATKQIASKTYQWAQYIFNSGSEPWTVNSESIVSWNASVTATVYHDFFLYEDQVGATPFAPFIQMVRFFNGQVLSDIGSGFPRTTIHGCNVFNNNQAASFLSASIEPYMGRMVVLKTLYG